MRAGHASGRAPASETGIGWPELVAPGDLELPLRVTCRKTPSEFIFSKLPPIADLLGSCGCPSTAPDRKKAICFRAVFDKI